ncbi:TIGR03086 family metal-binding protein [Streptomyces sp. NPDC053755]|uniref:TIGR03086 family metal-binding protein n=1 Tax=Streptomyces sp. NPDC053755 TaxID=3155815 RepID=UPI0034319B66
MTNTAHQVPGPHPLAPPPAPPGVGALLAAAARAAVPVVGGLRDDGLGAPTPCDWFTVRELLNHLFQVVVNFQALAAKETPDFSATPDYVGTFGPDWRERFADETARLVLAWSAPGAEEGTSGALGLPARTVGGLALIDLTVHAWDLARASGQSFTPDGECVRELLSLVREMAPMARQRGVFGEPCPIAPGASGFETLLALTGRDPGAFAEPRP